MTQREIDRMESAGIKRNDRLVARKTDRFMSFKHNDTTILVCFSEDSEWEIYYRKPQFPYIFAFGLPKHMTTTDAVEVARENVDNYADLFE